MLNLDRIEKDKDRGDVLKIEDGSFDNKISFKSSTESDEEELSPRGEQPNQPGRHPPGVNVSPSSIMEQQNRPNQHGVFDDGGSLNSSRMTGTQELSIHEGMQVMHEMENQQQKKNGKEAKKKKPKTSDGQVVMNLDKLQADAKKGPDGLEASGELEEIDENIAQYTVEQFLEYNNASELRSEHRDGTSTPSVKTASVRSSNRHGLFQVGSTTKTSALAPGSKGSVAGQDQLPSEYQDYTGQRVGSAAGKTQGANPPKSQKEIPTQALAHNMKM